jgi:hypothetical protein
LGNQFSAQLRAQLFFDNCFSKRRISTAKPTIPLSVLEFNHALNRFPVE